MTTNSSKEFQFYIVPTPIGNLKDITLRAIEVLNSVDVIACEDSRVTQKLLNHYDITTKLVSYHKYNEKSRIEFFINLFAEGKQVALVSDAGTPMICDPGSWLLKALIEKKISYTALPGACAITTFLSQTPRDNEIFTFLGFMPRTESAIKNLINRYYDTNIVFYESPNRIIKTLKIIEGIKGNIQIALSRELSKLFEESVVDSIANVIEYFNDGIKGEIVCMIYSDSNNADYDISSQILKLKDAGYTSKDISKILSVLTNVSKNDIYAKCQDLSK